MSRLPQRLLAVLLLVSALVVALGVRAISAADGRETGLIEPRVALYWETVGDDHVRCLLCPRRCVVAPGGRGHCGVRENRGGAYYTLTYGNPCAVHVDPIEKKPFYHFLPTSTAFSIATAGCNLDCKFCQNWHISQALPEDTRNYALPPERLVELAVGNGCRSIAYTYSEPTIFYEYMLDTAKLARERGIRNVLHSNGYINPEPLRELCAYIDAANIDLKGMSEGYYREMTGGSLAPVLASLVTLVECGVHVEITTLIVPGENDGPEMIEEMCRWIHDELGPDVPLHFSRFHPQYRLGNLAPTPVETLDRARAVALEQGLKYVYIGNVPGHEAGNTYCPQCGELLIRRIGYSVDLEGISAGSCLSCGHPIEGIWD